MDTQLLKAFQAVAEQASFSGAAESLHLTQPAISKRIASLESQLECRLFDRIGRQIALTEAGRALLPRARQILLAVSDTQRAIINLSGDISGELNVATSHHIGLHRLPRVLRQFTRNHPEVKLAFEFMDSEKAYEAVRHGDVELAIITLAPELQREQDKEINSHNLWPDPLQFVVSSDHPIASQPQITLTDLSRIPAILPSLNTYTTQLVKQLFDAKQLQLDFSMATNYLETIKMMVSIGLGWSVLPETIIDQELHVMTPDKIQLQRQLGCISHRDHTLSNAAKAFLNLLKNTKNNH
jgi:DNA-binding transcriptional LysR family regulator